MSRRKSEFGEYYDHFWVIITPEGTALIPTFKEARTDSIYTFEHFYKKTWKQYYRKGLRCKKAKIRLC